MLDFSKKIIIMNFIIIHWKELKERKQYLDSILSKYKTIWIDYYDRKNINNYNIYNIYKKNINFEYCSPTYLLIEVYNKDKENIDNFLVENDYELICNLSGYSHDKIHIGMELIMIIFIKKCNIYDTVFK